MQFANQSAPSSHSPHEPLADTLKLIMQHTNSWHLHDLCRLLQVSSSCRQALQQSRGKSDVNLGFAQLDLKARSKFQGFAEWLETHAGLVSSFSLWPPAGGFYSPEEEKELQLLQRQLAWALRVCRLKAGAAVTAGAAGALSADIQPMLLQLTDAMFHNCWPEPQLMRELAAVGVQELAVTGVFMEPAQLSPSYFATLSSLRWLYIVTAQRTVHSPAFMSAVQQLSALTSLQLGVVPADATHQLPPQLQGLTATFAAGSDGSTTVSLSHLTALRRLGCKAADGAEGMEVLLPPILTRLDTGGKVSRATGATALQEASIEGLNDTDINLLVHLCSLPVLGSLTIDNSEFSTPAASEVAAAALGSATALTRLKLLYVDFASGTGLCEQLAKLPRLVDLHFWGCSLPQDRSDLLCLTALTSLTSLALYDTWSVRNLMAAAVARHLTGLCELHPTSNGINSLELLPVVGALTGLSCLWLGGEQFVVGADDLMLLSSLTGVRELRIRQLQCSEAEKQQFLAGMPHLTRIGFI